MAKQRDPSRLRGRIEEKISRLEEAQIDPPATTIARIEGASIEKQARGAAILRPNSQRVVPAGKLASTARVTYEGAPSGQAYVETGSARLIRAGGQWRPEAIGGPWRQTRTCELPETGRVRLTFHLPPGTNTAVLPPRPASGSEQAAVYPIPPAATEIRGEGQVRYRTGHEIELSGRETLLRPMADGTLGRRPGGVYAELRASDDAPTPEAKIGPTWITLRPKPETLG